MKTNAVLQFAFGIDCQWPCQSSYIKAEDADGQSRFEYICEISEIAGSLQHTSTQSRDRTLTYMWERSKGPFIALQLLSI